MNSWSFTGNLGADAEQRYLPSGDAVVSFSVAVKSGFGEKAKTSWARCAIFGTRGQAVAPYLTKGQQVGVVGEVSTNEWEKDGQRRQSLEVRVNDLTLLGSKADRAEPAREPERKEPAAKAKDGFGNFEDDLPF